MAERQVMSKDETILWKVKIAEYEAFAWDAAAPSKEFALLRLADKISPRVPLHPKTAQPMKVTKKDALTALDFLSALETLHDVYRIRAEKETALLKERAQRAGIAIEDYTDQDRPHLLQYQRFLEQFQELFRPNVLIKILAGIRDIRQYVLNACTDLERFIERGSSGGLNIELRRIDGSRQTFFITDPILDPDERQELYYPWTVRENEEDVRRVVHHRGLKILEQIGWQGCPKLQDLDLSNEKVRKWLEQEGKGILVGNADGELTMRLLIVRLTVDRTLRGSGFNFTYDPQVELPIEMNSLLLLKTENALRAELDALAIQADDRRIIQELCTPDQ